MLAFISHGDYCLSGSLTSDRRKGARARGASEMQQKFSFYKIRILVKLQTDFV